MIKILAHHAPDAPAAARSGDRPAGFIVALSGRNQLRGFVEEVRIDGLLGQVRLRIGDQRLTAIITSDALSVLKLRRGDCALAIVKATEVMIAREADTVEAPALRRRRSR
jgi:molybdopterin-binding protein